MANPICRALKIRYPILLGGLLQVGTAPLVAAVSESGGFGILGAAAWNRDELKSQIDETRKRTTKPFGVNIVVRAPHANDHVRLVMEEKITAVTTSAGNPEVFTRTLKQAGVYVMHVVPTVEYALLAERAGVDAVIAEGVESGGFTSLDEVTTFTLVPQVVDAVKIPVLAAGGIGDGRGIAAAMALGAVGVQIGTVFLATEEAEVSPVYKTALLMAKDTSTHLVRMGRAAQRQIKEELRQEISRKLKDKTDLQELENETDGSFEWGDQMDSKTIPRIMSAGQVAGLVRHIVPVNVMIQNMVKDAKLILGPDNKPYQLLENR